MKTFVGRILLIAWFAVVPAVVKAEPLDSVPQECAVVIRFASIDQFVKNTNDLLSGIGGIAALVGPQVEQGIVGEMFELKKGSDGLDRSAPAFAVAFPIDGAGPPVAFIVKAKDEKALRASIAETENPTESPATGDFVELKGGRKCFVAKAGDYMIYTLNSNVVEEFGKSKGKLKLPSLAVQEAAAGDAALIVNTAHLVQKFQQEIAAGKQELLNGIDSLPEEQLGPSAEATKAIYKKLADLAFQAAFDSQYIVARTNLSAKGAESSSMFGFREGSTAAKYVGSINSATMDKLELLPAGQPMYFAANVDYSGIGGEFVKMIAAQATSNGEALKKAFDEMIQAKIGAIVASFSFPKDATSGIQSTLIEEAEDIKMLRGAMAKYMTAAGTISNGMFSQKITFKANAEKYKNFDIDLATTQIIVNDDAPPEVKMVLDGMYKKMFGGDSIQNRVTTVENMLLQVTGNNANEIRNALQRLDTGDGTLGLEKSFGATRDKLGEKVTFMTLIDVSQLIAGGINMMKDVSPFDQILSQIPFNFPVKPSTSYAGFSMGAKGGNLQLHGYVPVEQVKAIMQPFAPSF